MVEGVLGSGNTHVILAPPAPFLNFVQSKVAHVANFHVAAQNMHEAVSGAYTGEVSGEMLRDAGCEYVILGHSERREYFGEDEALLSRKISRALEAGLLPIYCVGETLEERESGQMEEVIRRQVSGGLFHLSADQMVGLVLAYEPVWAIGTGKTATPEQAQDVHAFIRSLLLAQFGEETAAATSILYGGSVKPANASELFAQPDIDGGLVGGASLKPEDFRAIIQALN